MMSTHWIGIEHFLRQPAFTPAHDAEQQQDDRQEINPTDLQLADRIHVVVEPIHKIMVARCSCHWMNIGKSVSFINQFR